MICSEHAHWPLIVFFPTIKGLVYVVDLVRDLSNILSTNRSLQ